jgi:hypothetical protein
MLIVDALAAAVLAAVVLIVSPGVALAGVIALLVLVLCAVSYGGEALVRRRRLARARRRLVRLGRRLPR